MNFFLFAFCFYIHTSNPYSRSVGFHFSEVTVLITDYFLFFAGFPAAAYAGYAGRGGYPSYPGFGYPFTGMQPYPLLP